MRYKASLALTGVVLAATVASVAVTPSANAQHDPAYVVEAGKVNQQTFNGYRRYGDSCHRCHGPDGAGSSYAPNLIESLKVLSYEDFVNVIINGRQRANATGNAVMPAFGTTEDVVLYMDDLYGYLKARSDDKLPRGRPKRLSDDG
ncbi:MAG: c-type cytochrome [Gemmatimonadaceae bacterium]|nr:c-type cytochrome [Acetobacteraceae bacterium]